MSSEKPVVQGRREFLGTLATGGAWWIAGGANMLAAESKPLRGIFPIAQSPFTESGKLDVETLVEELRFLDRGRVHGFVWPQLASEWSTLSEQERLKGAEAIAAAGKKLRPAIVLGVQAPTTAEAANYARHAEKVGADAIICLPPPKQDDPKAVLSYYQAVWNASGLPLFVQAVGNMSVELLLELHKNIPTCRYVKDEAGQPLARIAALREKSRGRLNVFTGSHGRTLIDEMGRGFSGSMPAAGFGDLYAATWDLWHEGKKDEALEMFSRVSLLLSEVTAYGIEAVKYILVLRRVFKNYTIRESGPNATPGVGKRFEIDENGKQVIRQMLDHLKPYLRA